MYDDRYDDFKTISELFKGTVIIGIIATIYFVLGEPFINLWCFVTSFIQENVTTMNFFVYLSGILSLTVVGSLLVVSYENGGVFQVFLMLLLFYNVDYMLTGESKLLRVINEIVLYLF